MGGNRKKELPLYSNKLNIKKFENLLSNNDQSVYLRYRTR